jgi:hypothetical protein
MPIVSHAGQSFSSLAWGFKFLKFSILDSNFINRSRSKQKLICKEGIHADTYEFVIIQIVSVFITHLVCCFSTLAFCLERDYFVAFKMCHKIMTRSVLLLLQFVPYGTNFTTFFLLQCESRKQQFHPSPVL